MLAGHPFAGKSMLVSGLFRALETGEPFLGRTTKAGSALLVTEEDQASLRERAGRFDLFAIRSEDLDRSSSVGHDWAALIASATELALAEEHRLLVIDTFPGLAGSAMNRKTTPAQSRVACSPCRWRQEPVLPSCSCIT